MSANGKLPSYRLHKPTGQAVVTVRTAVGRKDIYLGRYGSRESKREYARVIQLLTADPGHFDRAPSSTPDHDLTVSETVLAYWEHAQLHYRSPGGKPTSQVHVVRMALKPLVDLFGGLAVRELGPRELRAALAGWVGRGLARRTVNNYLTGVRVAVKWMTAEGMVPPAALAGLQAVGSLKRHRSGARETDPREPVPDATVEATLPLLPPKHQATVLILRLTGMRPGELVAMRPCDLDQSGPAWAYRPAQHKTAHRGRGRTVWLGPRAQAVLRPWLDRSGLNPRDRVFGLRNASAVRLAVVRACRRGGVGAWFPYQLRHAAATAIRGQFGLGAAGAVLGHTDPEVTTVYAKRSDREAAEVALAVG
jgi:integrase